MLGLFFQVTLQLMVAAMQLAAALAEVAMKTAIVLVKATFRASRWAWRRIDARLRSHYGGGPGVAHSRTVPPPNAPAPRTAKRLPPRTLPPRRRV